MRESEEKVVRPERKVGKLVIMKDDSVVGEVQLGARKIAIGRDAASDVHLNDLAVSRHHACLTRVYDEYFVEDLKSTNGTFLNYRQVSKHMLKHGDTLRIGGFTLQLVKRNQKALGEAEERDPDRTVVLQAGNGVNSRERRRPSAPETALLRFTRGPKKGQSERLGRSLFTIGKPGGEVAAIARRPQGYFLLHIGGSRYPRLNDREINTTKGVQLNEGDVLEVGDVRAQISFRV
jgi:pSer/pThr/pTyr-binding forkhead associated (FHA) protein